MDDIGLAHANLGDHRQTLDYYDQALPITRDVGDRAREAPTLNNIGAAHGHLGDHHPALEYHDQAATIERDTETAS